MVIHRHVKLQELLQIFLRVQGLAQCAPQAVLQLIVLLEELHSISWLKSTLLLISIQTNLTIMMVSNLPLKIDASPKPAAYNPYTRLFIGLRMVSSFGSRCLAVSIFFSASRCNLPQLISASPFISHLVPLSILLIPRLIFTIFDYTFTKIRMTRQHQRNLQQQMSDLEAIDPSAPVPRKTRFSDILLGYIATVFIPFGDPLWIFWYVSLESLAFMLFGLAGDIFSGGDCFGVVVGAIVLATFLVLFGIVPCVVPVISDRVKTRSRGGA